MASWAPVRVLFFVHSVNYDRLFEDALDALLGAGHEVVVAFDRDKIKTEADSATFDALAARHGRLTWGPAPQRTSETWPLVARGLRYDRDYLRYLEPAYASAEPLRARARERAHGLVALLAGAPAGRRALARALASLDRAVPLDPAVVEFVRQTQPDVVLVTPLVNFGSPQDDYVRAARTLGIPSVLPVASWDNLTNKGLIREQPDVTLVWNEAQRREAVELHALPPASVVVTGAHSYDHWFDWAPTLDAHAFAEVVGLDASRPYVLYAGSSSFIAPDEPTSFRRWLERLRASDVPAVRDLQVLARPHPTNIAGWDDPAVAALGARVWPPAGERARADAKAGYFDSLHHSAAVVGLNTSAFVEAAIVDRPVLTLVEGETAERQDGTLHFEHVAGGVLRVARDWGAHERQLVEAVAHGPDGRERAFVASFVRPRGIEHPASPFLVESVEQAAGLRPTAAAPRPFAPRLALFAVAAPTAWRLARKRARKRLRPVRSRFAAAARTRT